MGVNLYLVWSGSMLKWVVVVQDLQATVGQDHWDFPIGDMSGYQVFKEALEANLGISYGYSLLESAGHVTHFSGWILS